MNFFDSAIISFFNQFSQASELFDFVVGFLSKNHLVKGGVLLIIFWWAWFKASSEKISIRIQMVSVLLGCFLAMVVARALALILPFRFRPIHQENLDFQLPLGMSPDALDGWSSFPSDHGALFFALATGIFCISKKAGLLAFVYTVVFIALPRIYLGLHYPTDILAGALVGVLSVLLCCKTPLFEDRVSTPVYSWSTRYPEFFYPAFFIISYQIADMFDSSRSVVSVSLTVLKSMVGAN